MNIDLVKKIFNAQGYGVVLAHSSDADQAEVLNSMALEMKVCMTAKDRETQICYLSNSLSEHARDLIKQLAEFIALREQNK